MPCDPEELKNVPLFALLDDDEVAVLAAQVDLKSFAARQRIYKIGDPGMHAYILLSGGVQVTTVDEIIRRWWSMSPGMAIFLASPPCLSRRPTKPAPWRSKRRLCVEVSRDDIAILLQRKPLAGMDMLTVSGISSMPPSNWCEFAPAAIPMN